MPNNSLQDSHIEEIEIIKWVVRVDNSTERHSATLIGLDADGNEYTQEYWDGILNQYKQQDIICTQTQ